MYLYMKLLYTIFFMKCVLNVLPVFGVSVMKLLTSWNRIIFEKQLVALLVRKFFIIMKLKSS
jgi:hypothetical protein